MIEIPDEGLMIWLCGMTEGMSKLGILMVNPEECAALDDNHCCTYRGMDGKLCDAQAYRIVKEATVVVAPGIMVSPQEYEQRYQGIDLTSIRQRMPPDLFRVFVRYIGSIPGHPDTDAELWGEKRVPKKGKP